MKMYVDNIRLELQMEIKQRCLVSWPHRKGMKLPAIVADLAAVSHEYAFGENRVKYWWHEIKLHRSDLSDRPSSGRPPLEDIDARMIVEFPKIPASTVHLHLTTSRNMKSRHFKWVPHFHDGDLRAQRVEGARQLLDVLQAQERWHFWDLVRGDETWVYLDMKPETIWLPTDGKLSVRVKRTVASEKRMLIVFCEIHGIIHSCWLPKDDPLDSSFFCKEVLSPLAQKMQPKSKKLANPWFWFIWTIQEFTRQGRPKRNWMFPDSNAGHGHPMAWIFHHPILSFRLAENPAWTERT
jgi:hypothetical protein